MSNTHTSPAITTSIELFLGDAMLGASQTRAAYRTALNAFVLYLSQEHALDAQTALPQVLTVDQLLTWPTWLLDERGVSQRTLQTYLAALVRYVEFLQIRDWLEFSGQQAVRFREGLRRTRKSQRPAQLLPHPPTAGQVQLLLEAARQRAVAPENERVSLARLRDIALIETLRCTGLRVSEAVGLKRKQLRQEADGTTMAWIVGKGRKERQVFFDGAAWRAVQTYLDARKALDGASGRPLGELPVFARHDKRAGDKILRLSTEAVERMFQSLAAAAGLGDAGITPHALRHFFATKVYQTTHDLSVTQTALGHSSPVTTRVYAKLEDGAVRDAHRAAFPARRRDDEHEGVV